jgi:hypothetical protein
MSAWMAWGISVLATTLNFGLQVWPRWKNRYFGVDNWRHLDEADVLRRTRRLSQGKPNRYLIEAPSDYPPLLRVVLAAIPKEILERWEWCVAPVFDAIHHLLLFATVYGMTGNWKMGLLAQITYAASPLIILENSNLTTRSFASLLFTLGWLPVVWYAVSGLWVWLLIGIVFLSLLCLAHRLAVQALVFLGIFTAIFHWDWIWIGAILAAMGLAFVISGGFYRKVLYGQLAMLNYWRVNIRNRFAHQIRGLPKRAQEEPDIVFRIYQAIRRAPFVAVLGANPMMLFLIPWWMDAQRLIPFGAGLPGAFLKELVVWASILWGLAFLIRQCPPVRFLGEGERYLEYAAFPNAILTAVFMNHAIHTPHPWLWLSVYLALAVGGGFLPGLILQRKVVLEDIERSVHWPLRQIFQTLNEKRQEVRLFTVPLYLASAAVHFTGDHVKVLTTDSSYAHWTDLKPILPVLQVPLPELVQRYRLTHLLMSERYVTLAEMGLSESDVEKRSGIFCLVRLDRLSTHPKR